MIQIENDTICVLSNYIYLICGVYLILNNRIVEGIIAVIIWYVSHRYHCDQDIVFWSKLDEVLASLACIYVLLKNFNKFKIKKNIIFVLLVALIYIGGRLCYTNKKSIYNMCHSLWHIVSAIFITYIVL